MKARFRILQIALLGLFLGAILLLSAKAEEEKPKRIHAYFRSYEKDAVSGKYIFIFDFTDRKDGGGIRLKMGDWVGAFKIVDFKVKTQQSFNDPTADGVFPRDCSEITLERMGEKPEKLVIKTYSMITVPDKPPAGAAP